MWEYIILALIIFFIFLLLVYTPQKQANRKFKPHSPTPQISLPGTEGFILTEKYEFEFDNKELQLFLYTRNFDGQVKAVFKKDDKWMTIPSLSVTVGNDKIPQIPQLENVMQHHNYLMYTCHSYLYLFLYNQEKKLFEFIPYKGSVLHLDDVYDVENLVLRDDYLEINKKKYLIKNKQLVD